ncbi:HNH endonuclease [Streptomyces sp. NPDC002467]|uniref:HNH endonuclease n=1 Tax=Streptomyces sp. NPDC002467 TaxID=3364647 RepID=UPI0036CF38AC
MSRGRPDTATRARIVQNLTRRDGARCFYCRDPFGPDMVGVTLDHYVPRTLWKTWRQRNLVLACSPCNQSKADVLPWTVAALLLRNVRRHQLWRDACSPSV